jgi:hypothetical protein
MTSGVWVMKENLFMLVGSDVVGTEQLAGTFRRVERLEPEKALLLAVLEDAIDCFLKPYSTQDRIGKERSQEAEWWIVQTRDDRLFSFESVCQHLGLDPQYLRQGLLARRVQLLKAHKQDKPSALRGQAA